MRDMNLTRTFWPVGHGAFYTEQFNWADFIAVYDCGGKPEIIGNRVNSFSERVPIKGSRNNEEWVDLLFISHFHEDHFNGVKQLLNKVHVERIVLPYLSHLILAESFVYNSFIKGGETIDISSDVQQGILELALDRTLYENGAITEVVDSEDGGQRPVIANELPRQIISGREIQVLDEEKNPFWKYVPVNKGVDEKKCKALLDKLSGDEVLYNDDKKVNWDALKAIIKDKENKDVRQAYAEIFGKFNEKKNKWECNHNAYSMPVFSGPILKIGVQCCDLSNMKSRYCRPWCYEECCGCPKCSERFLSCLYMGDFEAKEANLAQLKQILRDDYYRAGTQQVPHHYSPHNHNKELYLHRLMAFGNIDDHKDVSFCHSVSNEIENIIGKRPLVVTEKDDTRCDLRYKFS